METKIQVETFNRMEAIKIIIKVEASEEAVVAAIEEGVEAIEEALAEEEAIIMDRNCQWNKKVRLHAPGSINQVDANTAINATTAIKV